MSWRPALRIARREALRARGRSALVVAMVALPVLGIAGTDILVRSAQLDPDERLERELGQTQARLVKLGEGPVLQPPDPDRFGIVNLPGRVEELDLPAGFRVLVSRQATLPFETARGEAPLLVDEVAVGDPAFAGKYEVLEGRAPRGRGEIAVTRKALRRLGADVGDTVTVLDPQRSVRLAGVVEEVGQGWQETVWAAPGSLVSAARADTLLPPILYLAGTRPVTWEDVQRLNRAGLTVFSRHVILDPPPRSDVRYFTEGHAPREAGQAEIASILAVALVVSLAVLEVVLLAGAAFAVGARRQARSLGLVAAAGGDRRHVRRVVLAGGLVLGVVGAVLGLALGVGAAALAMPLLERYQETEFGRFDLRPLELAGAAAVGVVSGLLAAVLPARNAARRDPVEALTGRRGQVRTPRRVPVIGVIVALLGVGASVAGSALALSRAGGVNPGVGGGETLAAGLIAGGAVLTQLGLIVCSPAIVGLAGRWARRLPLALRLALTDASRHRGRSAPAVAAVLTAVTGATALALVAASFDRRDREHYVASAPEGTAVVPLEPLSLLAVADEQVELLDADAVLAAVRPDLPVFRPHVVRGMLPCRGDRCVIVNPVVPKEHECPLWRASAPSPELEAAAQSDPRCDQRGQYIGGILPAAAVGDAELVRVLAGRVTEEAERALAAGGVVVLDERFASRGVVQLEVDKGGSGRRVVRVPGVAVPTASPPVAAVLGVPLARQLGVETAETHLLMDFDVLPTEAQEDAARAAMRGAGLETEIVVERGYESDYTLGLLALVVGAALITLGAAGIATGLAQADARADYATLAAVGATPTLRRTLAAAQALAVAGLGTLLGVGGGLVPGFAFIGAVDGLDVVVPWATLVEVLVGIPLVAAACAWLLTRSQLRLERRIAA